MKPFAQRAAALAIIVVCVVGGAAGCATAPGGTPAAYVGSWVQSSGGPFLSLAKSGSLSGFDGCNTMIGAWSVDDEVVQFTDLATTTTACDGVDAWLGQVATATVDGPSLTLLNASGTQIGTLTREQ
ncbi:MAG: META domain-containing protein [Burkholderiaceae bacterium]|nr:META domain-containing protein [Microbacteriaceae bacterium]